MVNTQDSSIICEECLQATPSYTPYPTPTTLNPTPSPLLTSTHATLPPFPNATHDTPHHPRNPQSPSSIADDMVAPFFLCAAILLILALLYSVLFLCIMRLGTFYIDEDNMLNGRIYLCRGRCYIPLCWLLRLYRRRQILGFDWDDEEREEEEERRRRGERFYLPREERRKALEVVLEKMCHKAAWMENSGGLEISNLEEFVGGTEQGEESSVVSDALTRQDSVMDISIGEVFKDPVCSICLNEYEEGETYVAPKCPHRFHRDCILEWLEMHQNTGCPCCRADMISNEDVYETFKKIQKSEHGGGDDDEPSKWKFWKRWNGGRGGRRRGRRREEDEEEETGEEETVSFSPATTEVTAPPTLLPPRNEDDDSSQEGSIAEVTLEVVVAPSSSSSLNRLTNAVGPILDEELTRAGEEDGDVGIGPDGAEEPPRLRTDDDVDDDYDDDPRRLTTDDDDDDDAIATLSPPATTRPGNNEDVNNNSDNNPPDDDVQRQQDSLIRPTTTAPDDTNDDTTTNPSVNNPPSPLRRLPVGPIEV